VWVCVCVCVCVSVGFVMCGLTQFVASERVNERSIM